MISFTGCESEPDTASVTDGVPMSEVEAYEQAVRDMEAEDTAQMDAVEE